MRSKAVFVSMLMVLTAFVPIAAADHMSVGNEDAFLVGPSEEPDGGESVPGSRENPSKQGTLFERGLVNDTCYEADGSLDGAEDEAQEAAAADPYCGQLVYNEDTNFTQFSPEDQDYADHTFPATYTTTDGETLVLNPHNDQGFTIDQFDAVFTSYVGTYGISTCIPWCESIPGGQPAYTTLHDVLSSAGQSDDGDTAWSGDQGWQQYAANNRIPHATLVASDASGQYNESNGWLFPYYDESIAAFLNDDHGNPIDDDRLEAMVEYLKDQGKLSNSAAAQLCAFSPDDEISISAPQATFCEVLYNWVEPSQDDSEGLYKGDYGNACSSPTYFCAENKPHWSALLVCAQGLSGGCIENDPYDSTTEYQTWHHVVAPTESACETAQEPGFRTSTKNLNSEFAYLAHDLDVYVPATEPAGEEPFRGKGTTEAFADAFVDKNVPVDPDEASVSQSDLEDNVTGLPTVGPVVDDNTSKYANDDQVEPNAEGEDGVPFTVSKHHSIDRDEAPCDPLVLEEEEDHPDPWVNVIDNQVTRDAAGDVGVFGDANEPWGDSTSRDASNRPGPGMYYKHGKVGMFTDKNDDGDYDQAPDGSLFTQIQSTGAYPMFWDMWVNVTKTGEIETDTTSGCESGFAGGTQLPEQMKDAGYGPRTGLVQAVYLTTPTVFFSWTTSETIEYPTSHNVYVFMNAGFHEIRGNGTLAGDTPLHDYKYQIPDQKVRDAVDAAVEKATANAKVAPNQISVVFPRDDLQLATSMDFYGQCSEDTGGYTSNWGFVQAQQASVDDGDTIVTEYVLDPLRDDGTIGGGDIPAFTASGDSAYPFALNEDAGTDGLLQWFDVDPFDGTDRNTGSSAPPSGD